MLDLLNEVIQKLFKDTVLNSKPASEYRYAYDFAISLVLEELHQYKNRLKAISSGKKDPQVQNNFVQYIEAHLFDVLEVEEMMSHFHMSRATLYRQFKEATGHSIKDFVRMRRLGEAKTLLQRNELSVSEIAYLVGFGEPRSFSTAYKKMFGISPAKERESL